MNRQILTSYALAATALALSIALSPRPLAAQASTGAAIDTLHGVEVVDEFRWLEDLDDPAVREWAQLRDGLARSFTARNPRRSEFRSAIADVGSRQVTAPPYRRGGRLLYARFDPTGPDRTVSIFARPAAGGAERELVNGPAFRAATGETPLRFSPSPDGSLIAVGSAEAGSAWENLRVLDVANGAVGEVELRDVHATLSVVVWSADSRGFYYQAYDRDPDGGSVSRPRVVYHSVDSPQSADVEVYAPGVGDVFLSLASSPEASFLVIGQREGSASNNDLLVHPLDDPTGETTRLSGAPEASYIYAGSIGSRAWFRTDHDAPNGKVVAFDLERPRSGYVEVVPEAEESISTWFGFAPVGAVVTGERLLVTYAAMGRIVPRLFSLDGEPVMDVALPYEGSVWSGWVGREADGVVYYSLSGLVDPGTIYGLDLRTGESEVFEAPDLPYDLDGIATEYVRIPARDGAEVPAFVVRRKDTPLDGSAPLILYGYGFAGWNAAPYFYPLMASFVDRGGVWVVAVVRGDGGFGTAWHTAGRRRNKPTGIGDYVDVTRWLIDRGYTSADRMIANGSSAGGPLVSAAVTSNPDLYRAMILDYPLVDVLRYDRFSVASAWVAEYGTASDPADFEVLRSYSALHNLEDGRCYPATFLAPGENDGRTPPLHAYKLAAALETRACDAPVLLRTSWGAGHASGADLERSIANWADQLAFLDSVLPEGALR
ncbi:MAG: prolyl oligopeptidase family serine peptidase [Gemmatimonadota bacterium]